MTKTILAYTGDQLLNSLEKSSDGHASWCWPSYLQHLRVTPLVDDSTLGRTRVEGLGFALGEEVKNDEVVSTSPGCVS